MELLKANYDIRFTEQEIWNLIWLIQERLEKSIIEFYNTLQQEKDGESLFFEQKKEMLYIMEQMFGLVGRPHTYDGHIRTYKNLFEKKRKEREAK
ncbi:hypothetical protein A2Z67_06100 [Candidatus Woesebacteria bacterium RBG_13_36_22]|uniref:Uncharacterized protein n=1 Tax=Candidatus Woesebacteria bacterium RBG_13_36_22 TaxID=1802478 RepID=A0A1F7X1N6_9BACT|nr:MAG: hypothetical protein A2Z67_06100 [Candidatus Woesebacteria bacterium RBG_13_36_22]